MNMGIAIIGILVVLISIVPIVLSNRAKRNREKRLQNEIAAMAKSHGCNLTHLDVLKDYAVGADESKNFLFFYRHLNGNETKLAVNLVDIQSCRVVNSSRTIGGRDSQYVITDKVALCLTPAVKSNPEIQLEFYNADDSTQLVGELDLVEKWAKIINSQLKGMKSTK